MEITFEEELRINPTVVTIDNPYDLNKIRREYTQYECEVLNPTYRQQSFYNKAHIYNKGSTHVLESYTTPVLVKINGYYYKLWDSWSQTTNIHVNTFLDIYGGFHLSKDEWKKIPVNKPFRFPTFGREIMFR